MKDLKAFGEIDLSRKVVDIEVYLEGLLWL